VFTYLYVISPDTINFALAPLPENPCWIVGMEQEGSEAILIIDAVTGDFLGYGALTHGYWPSARGCYDSCGHALAPSAQFHFGSYGF
jgi:hypothetical protein